VEEVLKVGKYIDLTGMKFGRLSVIKQEGRKYNKIAWLCNCECGNTVIKVTDYQKKNQSCSCGCWNREIAAENRRKEARPNEYDLSQEYGIGYLPHGETFLFDKEDFDKIKGTRWSKDGKGYISNHNDKLHRIVTGCPAGKVVDHINHNKRDNRKCNLRICDTKDNMKNMLRSSANRSGIKGVGFHKASNKWRARITVEYKQIYLGSFETKEEAAEARRKAEEQYFKEFRCTVD
jgi:hypothetical protein